jgi:hypothetical protein
LHRNTTVISTTQQIQTFLIRLSASFSAASNATRQVSHSGIAFWERELRGG